MLHKRCLANFRYSTKNNTFASLKDFTFYARCRSVIMIAINGSSVLIMITSLLFQGFLKKIQENFLYEKKEIKMKLSGLLLLLTIFTVTLATPLNLLTHSPLCGDECTVTCGPCTCVFGCCTDTPHCSKVIKPCTETCSDTCSVTCGDCIFKCVRCIGTPPLCGKCTRMNPYPNEENIFFI